MPGVTALMADSCRKRKRGSAAASPASTELPLDVTPTAGKPIKESRKEDFAQRKAARAVTRERVVKCSLQKALKEKSLMPEIAKWVDTVSKITNKGSLVFGRNLVYCLKQKVPLPDLNNPTLYFQCFNVGYGEAKKRHTSRSLCVGKLFQEISSR